MFYKFVENRHSNELKCRIEVLLHVMTLNTRTRRQICNFSFLQHSVDGHQIQSNKKFIKQLSMLFAFRKFCNLKNFERFLVECQLKRASSYIRSQHLKWLRHHDHHLKSCRRRFVSMKKVTTTEKFPHRATSERAREFKFTKQRLEVSLQKRSELMSSSPSVSNS